MSNVSQFFGGAPKRILRGATAVETSRVGDRSLVNLGIVNTGVFVDPTKSFIVSSYVSGITAASLETRVRAGRITGNAILSGSGSARISDAGEIIVSSGNGLITGSTIVESNIPNFYFANRATVYWEAIEY